MAWQDAYAAARWTNAFGLKTSGYDPVIGHRGTDLALAGGRELPAWERLTVIGYYESANLGHCMIAAAADGAVFGIAHLRGGTRADIGRLLVPGEPIAKIASGGTWRSQSDPDFPGLQWDGSHAHITMTRGQSVFGSVGLLDARPRIIAAASGKTPIGGTPVAYRKKDQKAFDTSRIVQPGDGFYLHTDPKQPTKNAANIVGAVGEYSITLPIYLEGNPGDVIDLVLRFVTNPGKKGATSSDHYRHRFIIGETGFAYDEAHFEPYVGSKAGPVAVYARLDAPKTNRGPVTVHRFDSVAKLNR